MEDRAEYRVPGRPGVKQSEVDRFCDQLLMRGERPTIEKIRTAIGGSPNNITELLDHWWRRLGARVERGSSAFERLPGTLALQAEAFFMTAIDEARAVVQKEEAGKHTSGAKLEANLSLRSHVLTLREKEFAEKLEQRESRAALLEDQVRGQTALLERTLASKDSLQRQVDELRIVVATLQARHASTLLNRKKPAPKRQVRKSHASLRMSQAKARKLKSKRRGTKRKR